MRNVKISESARINVEHLEIGEGSVIGEHVLIEGRSVKIGREAWIDSYAHIGGGSCFDYQSELIVGDFLHMGKFSHVNAARKVTIGDEVGFGGKIFSHGAYVPAWEGFPVQFGNVEIGSRVWMPFAWVNPGVKIGDNVVVSAMSLVNRDLPSGCLAGGIPATILRMNVYPRMLTSKEKLGIVEQISRDIQIPLKFVDRFQGEQVRLSETSFDLHNRVIEGPATEETELLKNQLRRYGIRFKYSAENGSYKPWGRKHR